MEARQALRQRLAIVLRWSPLLLLGSLMAGAIAWGINQHQTPIYEATTTVLIDDAPGTKPASDYQSILGSERQATTYGELLTARPLLAAVIQKLGLGLAVDDLRRDITVSVVRDTQLIRLQVRDANGTMAAQIANTLITMFIAQTHDMQTARFAASKTRLEQQMAILDTQSQRVSAQLAGLKETPNNQSEHGRLDTTLAQYRQSYANLLQSYEQVRLAEAQTVATVVQVEPASVGEQAVSPRVLFNTLASAGVALVLLVGLALLYDSLDDRVRGPDEIERALDVPILGFISHTSGSGDAPPRAALEQHSRFAESFRGLRSQLQWTAAQRAQTLLITSPAEGDGKSTVVANLATMFAAGRKDVLVIDADLRHPRLHRRFGLPNGRGLSDVLAEPAADVGALPVTAVQGVRLLTAGTATPHAAELLDSTRFGEMLAQAQYLANVVLIDSPPLLAVTDAAILARQVDGVVLVVRVGATRLVACKRASEQLQRAGARLLGVVINDIPVGPAAVAYGYQGYSYDAAYASRALRTRRSPKGASGSAVPAAGDRGTRPDGDATPAPLP